MYIDTHAHIYSEQFQSQREEIIEKGRNVGVEKIFMPNIDHQSIDGMLELEEKFPGRCYAMMGLHPCSVQKKFEKELYIVEDWIRKRDFVAIGEIGMDLYWDKTFAQHQEEAFRLQVQWAKEKKLPIVIHCRESFNETFKIVEAMKDDNLKGVFHCFTGSLEEAQKIIDLGFYLGIGGVVTFKNGGLDEVLPKVDIERIVLETDSPYLAPAPHRGKRNEPSFIPIIAQKIADLMQRPLEDIENITTNNALKLFSSVT